MEAYQQLVAEGYLTSQAGGYTRIAIDGQPEQPPAVVAPAYTPRIDFSYGRADVAHFPRAAWLRSARRVLTETPNERFGYLNGRGVPELHQALADYLNRVRGTSADPETIVITSGYAQAVSLLMGVLAARGARTVAVEDPSASDDARPIAQKLGLDVVGVPVGDDGVRGTSGACAVDGGRTRLGRGSQRRSAGPGWGSRGRPAAWLRRMARQAPAAG